MAKWPLPVDFRWEDYLRLRFVDDQCLRTAMQGFLKGEISRKARLTRRETPFSKCQSCHNERNLPFNLLVYLKPKRYTKEWHWAQIQKPAKEDLMNLRHIRVPEIWLQPMIFMCLTHRLLSSLIVVFSSMLVLLQRWNCVVDRSRRLPTLTICKRSSLGCVCCPIFPLITYDKELSLLGKERLVAGLWD